ncbi:pickpocket protein 19 isoform X1 [Drosophila santomea]|uniref:pickpocket protein 19 isoform X1 n=1 Tax=Drosophila santomea TaxID=129105 RepID=UPI001952D7C4|nr:pickpocket protein 19 isoform X1 [Drosophila santomea]
MSATAWKPEPSSGDNDDDHEESKKQKKEEASGWVATRRYARIPLKIIAALVTVYVCMLSSERYFYYWVQTSIERTDMHVSEIDFPAVTIIPIHIRSLQDGNLSKAYNLVQSVIWQTPMSARLTEDNFTEFDDLDSWDMSTWSIYQSLQISCQHFFIECQWRRQAVNCCDLFRPTKTFNGYAYEFNSLVSSGKVDTWPWSVAASGSKSGLYVKIKRQQSVYTLNTLGVIVHEPTQLLGMSIDYSSEDRIVVPVEPLRFTAEVEVRARPVQMRRCYFANEIPEGRSRSECIYKCHFNYILSKCNCSLELPVKATLDEGNITDAKESNGRRICGVKDLSCFNKYKLSLFSMSNIIEESRDNVFTTVDCGCFPQCDHTQYHTSTYTEKLSTHSTHGSEIEIDVYFQEETLFSYRSVLRFTLIDLMGESGINHMRVEMYPPPYLLVVSFGGIAGLIMGISVLGCFNKILDHFACCRPPPGF